MYRRIYAHRKLTKNQATTAIPRNTFRAIIGNAKAAIDAYQWTSRGLRVKRKPDFLRAPKKRIRKCRKPQMSVIWVANAKSRAVRSTAFEATDSSCVKTEDNTESNQDRAFSRSFSLFQTLASTPTGRYRPEENEDDSAIRDSHDELPLVMTATDGPQFQRQALIARGAFGAVYQCVKVVKGGRSRAENESSLAMKISTESEFTNVFECEARILNALSHQNVVKCLHAFPIRGLMVLVFPYYKYSLFSMLFEDNTLAGVVELNMKTIFRKIIEGVDYLHSKGVLHRDLKPENIFLGERLDVVLGDFGAATYTFDLIDGIDESLAGTMVYNPPEALWQRYYDDKTDIWAAGCVLYEMCTLQAVVNDEAFDPAPTVESVIDTLLQMFEVRDISVTHSPNVRSLSLTFLANVRNGGARELIKDMLLMNGAHRPTAREVLNHSFLR